MDNSVIDLGFWQMLAAYGFVILLLILSRITGIKREGQILLASVRMTLQLILVGYVLIYIFGSPSIFVSLAILLVMESFAVYNIIKLAKRDISKELKRTIAISLIAGTGACVIYFIVLVIGAGAFFNPQYLIPISGMLVGNSMTGISIGVNRMLEGMYEQRHLVEGALMLGASPKAASSDIVRKSFDGAILPTINSMMSIGIVFLPGMMTGQILSGVSPLLAIKYQIAIMLGILGSVGLCIFIFTNLAYRTFFNDKAQLNF